MKTNNSKRILLLSLSFFNIMFGIFIGIAGLSIFFLVYDLASPGYYYRGFFMILSRLGIQLTSPIHDYYGDYGIFASFTSKYVTTFLAFFYSSIFLTAILYVLNQIRSILKISYSDTPFTMKASMSLKKIGTVILFVPMFFLILWFALYINMVSKSNFGPSFWNHWSWAIFFLKIALYCLYYAILGIFFFALGEVFNRGHQLKQENDLTV